MRNQKIYDNLPHSLKNRNGFPPFYMRLDPDQQELIDALINISDDIAKDKKQLKDMISRIRDCAYEIDELTIESLDLFKNTV